MKDRVFFNADYSRRGSINKKDGRGWRDGGLGDRKGGRDRRNSKSRRDKMGRADRGMEELDGIRGTREVRGIGGQDGQ